MRHEQPSFTWHPQGNKDRPGLVLLLVGIACFVAGALIGNLNTRRDIPASRPETAAMIDRAASGKTGPPRIVVPTAPVEVAPTTPLEPTAVQRQAIAEPEPQRIATSPPPAATTRRIAPAPTARRAKVVEGRRASSPDTSSPPTPTVRRIQRGIQASNADYQSLRRSILQQ
jgi:hypothetical protein